MRIVSLLPSATEIVYLLGLGDALVGVTHECDWPPPARGKPVVSHSLLPADAGPAEIDRLVSGSVDGGEPIYGLDVDLIRQLEPDLILTQDLCAVCAVPSGHVHEALRLLGHPAGVLSLDPSSIDDVLDGVLKVGEATGTAAKAEGIAAALRARVRRVKAGVAGRARPAVVALEWGDPPFNAGHWIPEMVEAAGGRCLLGAPGFPSVRLRWDQVAGAGAEVVVFLPCGYDLEAAVAEGRVVMERPEIAGTAFFAAAGGAFFSRPGPRVVDGVELLASALHPGGVPAPAVEGIVRLR